MPIVSDLTALDEGRVGLTRVAGMGTVFRDADTEPAETAIQDALGSSAEMWEQAVALFAAVGASVTWRHYREGGWLAKAVVGKKAVAWLAVEDGCVRVTFYFAERHRAVLVAADGLTADVRERIESTPMSGKLLPVTFEVRDEADLAQVGAVLSVKLAAR